MDTNFMTKVVRAIREFVQFKHNGNASQAGKALGLNSGDMVRKWLLDDEHKDKRLPNMSTISPYFEELGIRVTFPWEEVKEECQNCRELELEIVKLRGKIEAHEDTIRMLASKNIENKQGNELSTSLPLAKDAQLSLSFQNDEKKAI